MLIGGAITDRFSARRIMLASDIIRLVLCGLMAGAILTDTIQLWMVYAFSVAFGTVAGFFTPASNSIVPTLVDKDRSRRVTPACFAILRPKGRPPACRSWGVPRV
jgi:MFS family permease